MSNVVLRDIRKRFGGHLAVDGVSLTVRHGEFLSLLGPSGSGKTTLLRIIAGFTAADEGVVEIAGEDVTLRPPHRRNLGMVFQNYALFPHLTVAENVRFGLRMRRVPRAEMRDRVAAAIEMVGLAGLDGRFPGQLSGGQQQRVALARAAVINPDVMLLDEPLGALDLKLRRRMQIELKELQARLGVTLIYVTHDQEEALTMSDRVAVMNEARLLQVDPPDILYERPGTEFVADFIGETNLMTARVERVEGGLVAALLEGGDRVVFRAAEPPPVGADVRLGLRPERVTVGRDGPGHGNAFPVRVERTVFHGQGSDIRVRLPGGTRLRVFAVNDGVQAPGSGAEGLWVCWTAESMHLLGRSPQ